MNKNEHTFWKNKPVPDYNEFSTTISEIDDISKRKIYTNDISLKLPNGFKWKILNILDELDINNIIIFLKKYYEEYENIYREYNKEFIRWYIGDGFILGMESDIYGLCGIIGVIYRNTTIFDKTKKMAEINFLCVHKKLRKKNMASIMIDEVSRIICKSNIYQGIYITEYIVPTPITQIKYYYRPINFQKLFNLGFFNIEKNYLLNNKLQSTLQQIQYFKIYELPHYKYVEAKPIHYKEIYNIYCEMTNTFNIYNNYTENEFNKVMFDNKIINTFVYLKDDKVIDFGSFYSLSYNIKGSIETINVCYLYLYSTNILNAYENINNLIKHANQLNFDVFYIANNMWTGDALLINEEEKEEEERVYELKFQKGIKKRGYHFFNLKCPKIKPKQLCWLF